MADKKEGFPFHSNGNSSAERDIDAEQKELAHFAATDPEGFAAAGYKQSDLLTPGSTQPLLTPGGPQRRLSSWVPQLNRTNSSAAPPSPTLLRNERLLSKRGGWKPLFVLIDSLILLGAAAFSFFAQQHSFVFAQQKFTGKVINSSNVSALISAGGAVCAAVFVWGLALIGRIWLWRRVKSGKTIKLGQVMAIASRGAVDEIGNAMKVAGLTFVITVAMSWYLPSALSGALNPTLTPITEFVPGKTIYYQQAGSNGNASLPDANDCFSPDLNCPAKAYFADHYQAAQFAFGYGDYFQSWGTFTNATPPVPVQFGISTVYTKISEKRLAQYSSVIKATACVPNTQPAVNCSVSVNSPSVILNGGQISYDTPCGNTTLGQVGDTGGTSYTSTCNTGGSKYNLYHTVVADETNLGGTSTTRQLTCDITVYEGFRWIDFWAGDLNWFNDKGSCFEGVNTLSAAETLPLVSSVEYVLVGSAQRLTANTGNVRNPLYDKVAEALVNGNVNQLEMMVANSLQTASTVIYGLAFNTGQGTATNASMGYLDAWVVYNAYTWGGGWKGYIWATLLLSAGVFGLCIAIAGFFMRRLTYDPSSYAQTLFLERQGTDAVHNHTSVAVQPLPNGYSNYSLALNAKDGQMQFKP